MIVHKKEHWLDRAIKVYNFHVAQCKADKDWTLEKTAASFDRALGAISQDILLASWSITHDKQIKHFRSMRDALDYVRAKKEEMKLREI